MADPILEARSLRLERGGRTVLEGAELTLHPGEALGVLGPNGAGKTTLLRALAGLAPPAAGEVLLGGRNMRAIPRREAAKLVAYAPQEAEDRFGFSVRQCVLMGRHPWLPRFGAPSAQEDRSVDAALEALDIAHLAARSVTEISGGEKKRTALARTLVQGGQVALLDEPAAGLDIRHALAAMRVFTRRARDAGGALVAVLHDLNLAAMFCDRLLLLDGGRVAAYGPAAQVFTEENIARVFGVRCVVDGAHARFLED